MNIETVIMISATVGALSGVAGSFIGIALIAIMVKHLDNE